MARTAFALAVIAMMVAAAVAQTPFSYDEVTNQTHHYTFTQNSGQSSSYDYSNWQYAHVSVPQNAYLVYFNVSNAVCSYSYTYSVVGTVTADYEAYMQFVASDTMPCSPAYAAGTASSSTYYICNPYGSYSSSDYDQNQNLIYASIGDSSSGGYQTVAQVQSVTRTSYSGSYSDAYYASTSGVIYSTGNQIAVRPGTDMWLGLGFYNNLVSGGTSGYSYSYTCDVDINAVAYQCPIGQVAIYTNLDRTNIQGTCVTQQNITVVADTFQTISYAATDAQRSVIQLNNIPFNASLVIVNVTLPYSVSGTPYSSAGSELVSPDAYVNGGYSYGSAHDCGLTSGGYDQNGSVYVYTYVCFAPKWNSSFYIATDITPASSSAVAWSVSAMVLTCPAGFTGQSCSDPISAIPGSGSFSFSASTTGYQHFYFDVPTNSWNNTLVGYSASTSTSGTITLLLRRSAYSNRYDSDGIYFNSAFGSYNYAYYNYRNYRESGSFYVDGTGSTATMVSTPFERFSTVGENTRWVLTVACPGAGDSFPGGTSYACTGNININFPTSSIDLPTGSGGPSDANVLAPLSALLIALVALFLF